MPPDPSERAADPDGDDGRPVQTTLDRVADDPESTTDDADGEFARQVRRESEFGTHVDAVDRRELTPGSLGVGTVVDVDLGDAVDRFTLRGPAGEEVTVRLDSRPASSTSRAHAFHELLGLDPGYQLEAVGREVPFAYDPDGDRWLPIFPYRNTRADRWRFRVARRLLRRDVAVRFSVDADGDAKPRVEFASGPWWLLWSVLVALVLQSPAGELGPLEYLLWAPAAIGVGMAVLLFVTRSLDGVPVRYRVSSVGPYDARGP